MRRLLLLALFAAPAVAGAQGTDARPLAQEVLDAGATLFDAKDARAMAATYAGDAVLVVESRDASTGADKVEEHRGRGEVEDFYRRVFDGLRRDVRSRNTVEFARLLAPDLMVIHGHFRPDTTGIGADPIPFVQVRAKEGDRWRIRSLRLFLLPKG